jgi:hypothetical protein
MTVSSNGRVYVSERENAKEQGKAYTFELNPKTGKTERMFALDVDAYGPADRVFVSEGEGSPVFVATWKGMALFSSAHLGKKTEKEDSVNDSAILEGDYFVDIDGVKLEIRKR